MIMANGFRVDSYIERKVEGMRESGSSAGAVALFYNQYCAGSTDLMIKGASRIRSESDLRAFCDDLHEYTYEGQY